MGWSEQDEQEWQETLAGLRAEANCCADICARLAEMMESGAGEIEPGQRLRQAERLIRERATMDRI